MKRLIALLFAAAALATAFAPAGFANNGRADNGDPGRFDNCTGLDQNNDSAFSHGQGWHAADDC